MSGRGFATGTARSACPPLAILGNITYHQSLGVQILERVLWIRPWVDRKLRWRSLDGTLATCPGRGMGSDGAERGVETFVLAIRSKHVVFEWLEYDLDAIILDLTSRHGRGSGQ